MLHAHSRVFEDWFAATIGLIPASVSPLSSKPIEWRSYIHLTRVLLPGKPYPLGAVWDGHGVNFALYSEHGTKVDLCLFEHTAPDSPCETLRLREVTGHI